MHQRDAMNEIFTMNYGKGGSQTGNESTPYHFLGMVSGLYFPYFIFHSIFSLQR